MMTEAELQEAHERVGGVIASLEGSAWTDELDDLRRARELIGNVLSDLT